MRIDVNGKTYLFQWQYITDHIEVLVYLEQNKPLKYGRSLDYGAVTICVAKTKDADGKWQEVATGLSIARLEDLYYGRPVEARHGFVDGKQAIVLTEKPQQYIFDKAKSRKLSFKNTLTRLGLSRPDRERAWAAYLAAFPARSAPRQPQSGLIRLTSVRTQPEVVHA